MALTSGTSRPILGRPGSNAWPHLAVSSSSPATLICFPCSVGAGGGRAAVFLHAPAPLGGMEFFAANAVDLDLNSEAPDYPHL